MSAIHLLSSALDDRRRGELIYRGDIVVFKDVPPMMEVCRYSERLIREAFPRLEPQRAQFELAPGDYVARVASLQRRYRKEPESKRLVAEMLAYLGADPTRNYRDRLHLRVHPHGGGYESRHTHSLGFHRDSWASNVYQQVNWWTPIYPISAGRTMALYPAYWTRPIANTSAAWDLEEMRAHRKRALASGEASDGYPVVPEPTEPVDLGSELRLVIERGDVMCFSGAHGHATVPNESGLTRFSLEFRTVNIDDLREGRAAPNLDGRAPRVALDWFRRLSDGTALPEALGEA